MDVFLFLVLGLVTMIFFGIRPDEKVADSRRIRDLGVLFG